MADKGFNIHDLLVGKGSTLIIPPVLRDKSRFSKKNYKATFNVEKASARVKDFRVFGGAFPTTLKDQLDIVTIYAAL